MAATSGRRQVKFRLIDPAKLEKDADVAADDEEVICVPRLMSCPCLEALSQVVRGFLQEAYRDFAAGASAISSLPRSQTYAGGYSAAPNAAATGMAGYPGAPEPRRTESARVRPKAREPDLELEAKPFFERSAIFLRVKRPLKWGRGYGARSQPFKHPDIEVWRRIVEYDWRPVIEQDDISVFEFINHWFDTDFTRVLVDLMLALDPTDAEFESVINGYSPPVLSDVDTKAGILATTTHAAADAHATAEGLGSVSADWPCLVCKTDGEPTMNSAGAGTGNGNDKSGTNKGEFCSRCKTSRQDKCLWLCQGPGTVRCLHVMRMQNTRIGVPCCSMCETMRRNFQEEDVFREWANVIDEPPDALKFANIRA